MTNTTEKMTNKVALSYVLGLELPQEVHDKLAKMLEQVEKKSTSANGVRKPTAKQIENEGIKSAILEAMEPNVLYTIGDMLKQFDCFEEGFTSQRLSALVGQLIKAGSVVRAKDKGKAYFSLA